jgi:hypothetical protein
MEPIISTNETQREQGRVLINRVFPTRQHILRKDQELISLDNRDKVLFNDGKELIILIKENEVVGTLLLEIAPEAAYISYLTRHPDLPKGSGKILMTFAENRANKLHNKQRIRVSTVYHSECTQQGLVDWYYSLGYRFLLDKPANKNHQLAWELQYREKVYFRYFEKDLTY